MKFYWMSDTNRSIGRVLMTSRSMEAESGQSKRENPVWNHLGKEESKHNDELLPQCGELTSGT